MHILFSYVTRVILDSPGHLHLVFFMVNMASGMDRGRISGLAKSTYYSFFNLVVLSEHFNTINNF